MSLNYTEHPILKPPSDEEQLFMLENDPEAYLQSIQLHNARIESSINDPLNHGFEFPSWPLLLEQLGKWMEAFAFGGNGGSKSEVGAWVVVQCLMQNPGAKMYCFAQDDDASTQIQQRYVHKYLTPKQRQDHKTKGGGYVKYTQKNGFTDNGFIIDLEDGSEPRECYFYKYSQYQANKHKFEGYEYGSRTPMWEVTFNGVTYKINVGAWLDEYLESGDLYKTLLYRIPRRAASILTTFTPIDQMTAFVADKIKGSVITKTLKTDPELFDHSLNDKGMPREPLEVEWVRENRHSKRPRAGVGMVFFPSRDNPWSGYENMLTLHRHKNLEERKVRFHGIPSNVITGLFPLFSTAANVVKNEDFPDISDRSRHTVWHIDDHAAARNHFMLWGSVDLNGEIWIRKEWPDRDTYGEWALFGAGQSGGRNIKWRNGPAVAKIGHNVKGYAELFKEVENDLGIVPFERIGDSRAFAHKNDDNVDRFQLYEDEGISFIASDGRTEAFGLSQLDDWFHYNVNLEIDCDNRPKMHIHESCGNLIESLFNYNSEGVADEALKDPIDALRYFRTVNCGDGPQHVSESMFESVQPKNPGY